MTGRYRHLLHGYLRVLRTKLAVGWIAWWISPAAQSLIQGLGIREDEVRWTHGGDVTHGPNSVLRAAGEETDVLSREEGDHHDDEDVSHLRMFGWTLRLAIMGLALAVLFAWGFLHVVLAIVLSRDAAPH